MDDRKLTKKKNKMKKWMIREGIKKSKWKFKMVFAMKGGGLEFHIPIPKNDFFENHLESFPDC